MTRILFYLDGHPHDVWRNAFEAAIPGVDFRSYPDWGTPDDGPAYAFVWFPKPGLIAEYTNIKTIFSLGAGVDHILKDPSIPEHLPVVRMGDDGLKEGMAEFAVMTVLMHHRGMPKLRTAQVQKKWFQMFPPAAADVRIGMLGYGTLAKACTAHVKPFGYPINTWSRTFKNSEDGVKHYTGNRQLKDFLANSDIIFCLLPSTPETTGLLNAETMTWLPKGASIINAGRGSLINIDAMIKLLDNGHLSAATLDVFPEEPLPQSSSLWHHEKITISPHIAAVTRPVNAAEYVARNIARIERGELPENLLDRERGY